MGAAEIDLDHETGEVKLKKFISVADVGKAIHPEHCIAQEEGAAMQGIGHTFFEHRQAQVFLILFFLNNSNIIVRFPNLLSSF